MGPPQHDTRLQPPGRGNEIDQSSIVIAQGVTIATSLPG